MSTARLEGSGSWHLDLASIISRHSFRHETVHVPMHQSSSRFAPTRKSFSAIQPQRRKMYDDTDLTMDKLRFERVRLYGRDQEISKLREELQSIVRDGAPQRRVLLLSGNTGTGTTKLAKTLQRLASPGNGCNGKGKYDLSRQSQPYPGIPNACAELGGSMVDLPRQAPDRAAANLPRNRIVHRR